MNDPLSLPEFTTAERRKLDAARAQARARLSDELQVCWASYFSGGNETGISVSKLNTFFSPFSAYAAAMYGAVAGVLLEKSPDTLTYKNWLNFAAKTWAVESEEILPHWSGLATIESKSIDAVNLLSSASVWEEMMGFSWKIFRHPNKSALESHAYRLISALRDPLGRNRSALLIDIHCSISERTLHLFAKGFECSPLQPDSHEIEDYGPLTQEQHRVNTDNLQHNIEALKNDVEILNSTDGFAAARDEHFKATEPILRELERGLDKNQALRLFDESAKAMLQLVCSRKTRDAYIKVVDFVYYPEAHRYLTGGMPEGYARSFGGSFVRDICAEWREVVNELNARKRFWVNEAFKRSGDVNRTGVSVLPENKAFTRTISHTDVASELSLEQLNKCGLGTKQLPSTKNVPSFKTRATWLKNELYIRGWNKHDLDREGGPNNKTIQKILDGVAVRGDVLEKLADGLSQKGQKVAIADVPLD